MTGHVPDWFEYLDAAEQWKQHPADVAGLPHTKDCYLWIVWGGIYRFAQARAANYRARQQQQRQK